MEDPSRAVFGLPGSDNHWLCFVNEKAVLHLLSFACICACGCVPIFSIITFCLVFSFRVKGNFSTLRKWDFFLIFLLLYLW